MKNSEEAEKLGKEIIEVKDGEETVAIIYCKHIKTTGVRFLTPTHYPLQIGLLEHTEGKFVDFHRHPDHVYEVNTTQEMLYVEKGRVDIVITNHDWKVLKEFELAKGDFVLFVNAGHSVHLHKGSRVIEIKQGPYPGDAQAKIFKTKTK